MSEVKIKLNPPYTAVFEEGALLGVGERARAVIRAEKILIVTDSNVSALYLDRAESSLKAAGFETYGYIFKAGEKSKTAETYLSIINRLGELGFKRTDAVVALGGGVVGDMAGFAAATYMRGIDLIQAPTTLLAMIDSSIGGKTGVNLQYGKNLLGAFKQPKAVVADLSSLKTLPDREWKNGIGEGIKYACLAGGRTLEILMDGVQKNINEFVTLCAQYKADVVAADEKEGGLRRLLNLGHTVGHAIEKASGFEISHGAAVANGVAVMANAAYAHGELGKEECKAIFSLLEKYGIEYKKFNCDLCGLISIDKKAEGKSDISAVFIRGLGRCEISKMTIKEFYRYINEI